MNISFERSSSQMLIESLIDPKYDCNNIDKNKIKNYNVQRTDIDEINRCLRQDAKDYCFNGTVSFIQAINNILEKNFSWAGIEIYYAVYYFLRAKLALNNYAIFKANTTYLLNVNANESLKASNNKKYQATHEGTINHFKDCFPNDYLLSNNIGDEDAFSWLKNVREIINYRSRKFYEPGFLDIYKKFSKEDALGKIDLLYNDSTGLLFQEEYAIIGIPVEIIKKLKSVESIKFKNAFTREQNEYIDQLIVTDGKEIISRLLG